jgi:predicted phage tail protein|tara:strand:+ start:1502 stop:2083 length:582 start_codon:yes stop_codon:yes gene_type:complete
MLTTIKVYGSLAKFLGQRVFRAAVDTPLEAVSFLRANFEGLAAHMAGHDYKVLTGTLELQAGSNPEQLGYPVGMDEAISIVPVVGGAGGQGTGAILAGAALVAASLLIPGPQFLGYSMLSVGLAGGSLILSGVAQMLTPVPELSGSDLDPASNPASFSGIQNVDRQGVAVPVVYGETLVGSVVISSGINTQDD